MITFITRKWPPAVGGMERYSAALVQALTKRQTVRVMPLPGQRGGAPPGAVALVGFGLATAVKVLLTARPDGIVHVADMASWPLGLVARLRSRRWKIALSAHGTDVSFHRRGGFKGSVYGWYLRIGARCLRRAVVIANSAATAEVTREHGFQNIKIVPLATDMRPVAQPGPAEPYLLFTGRLVERKGCAWFIRNVLDRLPQPLVLKVAGTVWAEDEGAALEHPRVEFLGPLEATDLAGLHARAICTVTPNIDVANGEFEGFGLVAAEAAAAGGVSLAAAHSGLVEAVVDGVTGFSLPPGDADAWVAKIVEVLGWSDAQRTAFVETAMRVAQARYSWDRVAEETLNAYDRAG